MIHSQQCMLERTLTEMGILRLTITTVASSKEKRISIRREVSYQITQQHFWEILASVSKGSENNVQSELPFLLGTNLPSLWNKWQSKVNKYFKEKRITGEFPFSYNKQRHSLAPQYKQLFSKINRIKLFKRLSILLRK